jgi:PPM family protein phosphatase
MTLARNVLGKGTSAGTGDTIIRAPHGKLGFASNIGRVRPVDEDSLLAMEVRTAFLSQARTRLLLMVADGMGGHNRGELASRIAVQTVAETLLPLLTSDREILRATYHDELRAAMDNANQAIVDEARRHPECQGMGTTLSLAVADGRSLHVANAGDSRTYVVNAREIFQVTRDHSLVQELIDRGELQPEEARHHPRKNVITMALGVYEEVTPDIGCLTMEPGDSVLLCCDGLVNHVEDEDIQRVVVETSDPQTACEILIALANKGGGTDNISVILARPQLLLTA